MGVRGGATSDDGFMKYEYAGGVLDEERQTIARFEDEVVPYLQRRGQKVGEMAMAGDLDAEEVIRRYNGVVNGDPLWRTFNFNRLCEALKRWERKLH